jgi:hypothetical protein
MTLFSVCEDFFVTSDIAPETGLLEASSVEDRYRESSKTSKRLADGNRPD